MVSEALVPTENVERELCQLVRGHCALLLQKLEPIFIGVILQTSTSEVSSTKAEYHQQRGDCSRYNNVLLQQNSFDDAQCVKIISSTPVYQS